MVILIYWWTLTVSVWGMVLKAGSVLVGFQSHSVMPWAVVIQEKLMKNVPHWVKKGLF